MNATCQPPSPESCFPEHPELRANLVETETAFPGDALRRVIGGLIRWWRWRTEIRELRALNDHALADIGLQRVRVVPSMVEMIRETPDTIARRRFDNGDRRA